jgi:hypothetical protein
MGDQFLDAVAIAAMKFGGHLRAVSIVCLFSGYERSITTTALTLTKKVSNSFGVSYARLK